MVTSYVTSKVKTKHIVADVAHGVLMTAAHSRQCIETIRATCSAAVEPVTVADLLALVHTNEQHVLQVMLHSIITVPALCIPIAHVSSRTVHGHVADAYQIPMTAIALYSSFWRDLADDTMHCYNIAHAC
jgi:hypothetical protein